MTAKQLQQVRMAFAIHGLKIKKRPLGFMWDGETEAQQDDPSNMLHDLAHWIVAAPKRRTVPEFGLGAGPETNHEAAGDLLAMGLVLVTGSARDREESKASLLGITFEMRLRLPWRETFDYHGWRNSDPRPNIKMLGALILPAERNRLIAAAGF